MQGDRAASSGRRPFLRFLRIEANAGAALLLAIALALAVSNSPWANSFSAFWATPVGIRVGPADFSHPLKHWINDGLMTLFFFLVALELKREIVPGELRNPRVAALSIAGALGGMLAPAGIYLCLAMGSDGMAGWGTVMATDTALVVGWALLLAGLGLAFDASGIHPTLAGVALGLMTPARVRVTGNRLRAILDRTLVPPERDQRRATSAEQENLRRARVATREAESPVEQLERFLHPWLAFAVLPIFALANAGVGISPENLDVSVAGEVFAGLVIGKPLGVVLVSFLAVRLGVEARSRGSDSR